MKNYIAPLLGVILLLATTFNSNGVSKPHDIQLNSYKSPTTDSIKQSIAKWKQAVIDNIHEREQSY